MNLLLILITEIFLLYFSYQDLKKHGISIYPVILFFVIIFIVQFFNFTFIDFLIFLIIVLLFIIAYYRNDSLVYGLGIGDYLIVAIIFYVLGFNYLFLVFIIFLFLTILLILFSEYLGLLKNKSIPFLPVIFISFNLTLMVYFSIV